MQPTHHSLRIPESATFSTAAFRFARKRFHGTVATNRLFTLAMTRSRLTQAARTLSDSFLCLYHALPSQLNANTWQGYVQLLRRGGQGGAASFRCESESHNILLSAVLIYCSIFQHHGWFHTKHLQASPNLYVSREYWENIIPDPFSLFAVAPRSFRQCTLRLKHTLPTVTPGWISEHAEHAW